MSAKKLRPLPNNDSQKPLSERCCGALVAGHHSPKNMKVFSQMDAGVVQYQRRAVHFVLCR